ncbi:CoA transferase [Azospirillum sp. INR13]|uniref:CoA transferase n=1 Tax=Azospirillum sp. INR13 TaxID=2596919 RepID=UPI00351CB68A
MTLAQLGAEVIRIDPIGGNVDHRRWPLAPNGTSLYWTALNKAKRSVTLALDKPEGREIAQAIITASGEDAGFLLTNLPASGWMGYEALSAKRDDLIMMRLTGNPDGSAAVDYTVNCAGGFPMATGRGGEPVNHVLPAWDVAAGLYLATGLLAAERQRRRTGRGQEVTVALADVMLATVGNLGYLADVRGERHRAPADGQRPVRRLWPRLPHRRWAARDGRRHFQPTVEGARQSDRAGRQAGDDRPADGRGHG